MTTACGGRSVGLQIVVIDFVRKPITRETRETVWPTVMEVTGAEDVTGDALGVLAVNRATQV